MITWFDQMLFLLPDEGTSIRQHTYSRGFITERVIADFWQGLSRWMASRDLTATASTAYSAQVCKILHNSAIYVFYRFMIRTHFFIA